MDLKNLLYLNIFIFSLIAIQYILSHGNELTIKKDKYYKKRLIKHKRNIHHLTNKDFKTLLNII